jgi:serine/threonine protein kinase
MVLHPQDKVARYEVIREIAESMDIVYEGWDPDFARHVAIKLLKLPPNDPSKSRASAGEMGRDKRIERFKREAQALGALSHPNIMQVYDFGEFDETYFIVMEFVAGKNIFTLLGDQGGLDVSVVQALLSQALSALQYCHSKGVIHRDLKPENMQLLDDGTLKLLDFGIARMDWQPQLTQTGTVFGTIGYMSPEQLEGLHVDARSDLFSIGVIAYALLTGYMPFQGPSGPAIMRAILMEDPVYPPDLEPATAAFLKRALEKRYQTASEMLDALQRLGSNRTPYRAPSPVAGPTPVAPAAAPSPAVVQAPRPGAPQQILLPPSVSPLASALRTAGLVVLGAVLLCYIFPGWRIWIATACLIAASLAFESKKGRRIMSLPFFLAGLGILWAVYGGHHGRQPSNISSAPQTHTNVARTPGVNAKITSKSQLGNQATSQPAAKSRKNSAMPPVAQKPSEALHGSTAQITPKSKAQGPKKTPPKGPSPTDHPRLRGGSRLGDGSDSSQSSNDSPPPSRSGSKLGGDGE